MSSWEKANSNSGSDYITLWFWNLEKGTWSFSVCDNFPRDTRLSPWPLRSLLNIIVYGSKTDLMVQVSSVAQLCLILCALMDCSMPGFPPCPLPTPEVYPNSCPLSWWCHPTISCSVVPFSSCLQSFPASGSFQMSQLFTSGGQSIRVSASASVLPMDSQDWFPLG